MAQALLALLSEKAFFAVNHSNRGELARSEALSGLKLQNSGPPVKDAAPPPIPPAPPGAERRLRRQEAEPLAPAPKPGFLGKVLVKVMAIIIIINACALGFWIFKNWSDDDSANNQAGSEESYEDGFFDKNGDWQSADENQSLSLLSALSAENVEWPMIMLSGMVAGNKEGDMTAILNGKLVYVNQRVEGARLIEVSKDGVILELEDTREVIRIGEST